MATVNSNTCVIYIDNADPPAAISGSTSDPAETQGATPALKPIAYSTSAGVSISNATYEVNYKSATGAGVSSTPALTATRAFNVGTQSGSISFEGIVDWASITNTIAIKDIFDRFKDKKKVSCCWASTSTSASAYGGSGFITSFELSSSVDDFATFSGTIELTGDIVKF